MAENWAIAEQDESCVRQAPIAHHVFLTHGARKDHVLEPELSCACLEGSTLRTVPDKQECNVGGALHSLCRVKDRVQAVRKTECAYVRGDELSTQIVLTQQIERF